MSGVAKRVSFKSEDEVYIYPKPGDAASQPVTPPLSSGEDSPDIAIPLETERLADIEMSKYMQRAVVSPWNVFTRPTPKNANAPALANPGVESLLIDFKPSFFMGEIVVNICGGARFITVGNIYRAIDAYLDTEVEVTDPMFTNQRPQVQEEILVAFRSRATPKFDGRVQIVDFLRQNKFLQGVSVERRLERWTVRFGSEGGERSDIK